MKLLIVINSLILAGAEVLVADLVPLLTARGIDVAIAPLRRLDGPLEARLHGSGTNFLWDRSNRIYSPAHIWQLRPRFSDFDVVHTHLFPAQLWATAASRGMGKKPILITTEHNTENNRRKLWLRPADRYFYTRYDHIVSNSEATRQRLLEWLPGLRVESSVIPNGVSLKRFASAAPLGKEGLGIPPSSAVLLSVARMQPQKDHATLLRAFAKIHGNAHLVLVGDGELRPALEQMARDLRISDRTHFLGRRADVPGILCSADAFVHATHSDGFCLAVVEAMAAGLPVIASSVPGLSEVVGAAGLQVAPRSPEEMAQAISSLLQSVEWRRKLGRAGQARAQEFDISRTADGYAALYQRLLAGRRQAASMTSR